MRTGVLLVGMAAASLAGAQIGGGAVYGQGSRKDRAQQGVLARKQVPTAELAPAGKVDLEAHVLVNVKADRYVAVFALTDTAPDPDEAFRKSDETVAKFRRALEAAKVPSADVAVDFVVRNRQYRLQVEGDLARESLAGFEVKRNVSIRYADPARLDGLMRAAASAGVVDLIKVDYVVSDIAGVRTRLRELAAGVVRRKAADHMRLFGQPLSPAFQLLAERPGSVFPTELYDSYAAAEADDPSSMYLRGRLSVIGAPRIRTFFYNPLDAADFDVVVNPVVLEPVVQFTLYLKVRASLAPAVNPKAPARR